MNWIQLTTQEELENLVEASETKPVLIFKYSSRCAICDRVQDAMEYDWEKNSESNAELITPYFLDLIKYRSISNSIVRIFDVTHESPQALVIKNGKCIYAESHGYIRLDEILKSIKA